MALHLIKLCVGVKSTGQLQNWQSQQSYEYKTGQMVVNHVTRNFPKRRDELLDGGSLYWVISGKVIARNAILGLEEVETSEGLRACAIILGTPFIVTQPHPHRPFQGWRYYAQDRVPQDISTGGEHGDLPQEMLMELRTLGLL
jgi:hypothetical protein